MAAANSVSRDHADRSRNAFKASSEAIASTLQLDLQHEADLDLTAGAFIIGDPGASQSQFVQWTNDVHAFTRYPELAGLAAVAFVTAPQLRAFETRVDTDAGQSPYQISPPGLRPYYCLTSVAVWRAPSDPTGTDYCQSDLGTALLAARDSGEVTYLPLGAAASQDLMVGTPIYRGGLVPTTVLGRQEASLGWTDAELQPNVLLSVALKGHPNTAVAFEYSSRSTHLSFQAGSAPRHASQATIALGHGWDIRTYAHVSGGGVLGNWIAMAFIFGGTALGIVLGALILVLGFSRIRALKLVSKHTNQLSFQANHDSLTGLPNRALILDRIDRMLASARREHTPMAALFLDLDNFKDINDTLGHSAGDQLLVAVATRLSGALRDSDTVGRLGGDEFVVLADGVSLAAGPMAIADRILKALSVPIEIASSEQPLAITTSIGIAVGLRTTPEDLLRDADIAMYEAKALGRHRAVVFNPSMQNAVNVHRRLEVDLGAALDEGQFFLLYQPTFALSTGAFTGVEALLRWNHPTRGVVLPDDFIPELELSGLIVPVGRWVLETACRQGAIWHREGHQFTISVNVAAEQLQRMDIVTEVKEALSDAGLQPSKLILEITETTMMRDVEGTISRLALLRELGVRMAIDDFGTGYSSLAYLIRFPIDVLKIDRTFVAAISDSAESAGLVHTLVQLGKLLGLEIIAEGIENDDQRRRLKAEDVDTGQGFHFARPLDIRAIDRLLVDHPEELASPVVGRSHSHAI